VRPQEESAEDLQRLLREVRECIRDRSPIAAGEALDRLLQRWPDNTEAFKLHTQMLALEQGAFKAEVGPLLDRMRVGDLAASLSSLSLVVREITQGTALVSDPPTPLARFDEAVKRADLASIRSALSRNELEEAEARAQMAVLSFPNADDVLGLESEVREQIRKDNQIRVLLDEAEDHLSRHNWKTAIRLFNSASRLDPGRDAIKKRIAEAFRSWAEELRHEDLRAALKLAETAVSFDPESTVAQKLRSDLADGYRTHTVAQAMSAANDCEAKGDLSRAFEVIRSALDELPDQLTLVLRLKELDKTKRSKEYEQELRSIQNDVLNLSTRRQYSDAEGSLRQFLQKYPESATAITLLEGVQRDHRQYLNTQIADKALQDIAPLEHGDLKSLKRALATANEALRQVGAEPRLAKAIRELESRLAEGERHLADLLQRAEDDILQSRFNTAIESLQGAAALDSENARIGELRAQLKRARSATRRTAMNAAITGAWTKQKRWMERGWTGLRSSSQSVALSFSSVCRGVVAYTGSAGRTLSTKGLSTGKSLSSLISRSAASLYTVAWVQHRMATVLVVVALGAAVAGIAGYRYIRNLPDVTELAIESSPAGAKVLIDGKPAGTTPSTASWRLRRGEKREVAIRLELDNYEPFEEVVKLSGDQLRLEPLNPKLKLANVAEVVSRLYESARTALKAGALLSPPDGSVVAYLDQMRAIDPEEQYLRTERADLKRDAINAFKDRISQLKPSEKDRESELTRWQEFARLLAPNDSVASARIKELEAQRDRQKQDIQLAITSGSLIPPSPKNAFTALDKLKDLFPGESEWVRERREETRQKVVAVAQTKCELRSLDCDQYVVSALGHFPDDPELKSATKRVSAGNSVSLDPQGVRLETQMDRALRNKSFVLPPQESAVDFANEIQRTNPGYSRAADVKKIAREETEKEIERLTARSQESRALRASQEATNVLAEFRRARSLLAAIIRFWPEEAKARRQFAELKTRIDDIEGLLALERSFSVIHDHRVGECRGQLVISPYGVSYSGGSDAFDRPLSDLRFPINVENDELELRTVDNRNWTFKINPIIPGLSIDFVRNRINDMKTKRSQIENRRP
jgi:outer membrane protein assembly factor BamD (BamD/ComL family)